MPARAFLEAAALREQPLRQLLFRWRRTTSKTCRKPISAVQSFFSTLTQISPAFDTFGWNIFVMKKPTHSTAVPCQRVHVRALNQYKSSCTSSSRCKDGCCGSRPSQTAIV